LIHALVKPGQTIVAINDLYGGSVRLMRNVFGQLGINLVLLDVDDSSAVQQAMEENDVALLRLETPTNPLLKIADIKVLAHTAKQHNILTVVDNTFATPYFQQPLDLGADIVLHSATKYLGGHSDLIS
jgi:cystathionine beta-lyase/cystathionine gamma-synthase